MAHTTSALTIPAAIEPQTITGVNDEVVRQIEEAFDARITVRGDIIEVSGDEVEVAVIEALFADLVKTASSGEELTLPVVRRSIEMLKHGEFAPSVLRDDVLLTYKGRAVRPKTAGQKHYVDAIRTNTITFGIGPAGTGKTYLAMAIALSAMRHRACSRIILTRPVVEAGESLGFLPGTLNEKVDPYIRPLYDAIYDITGTERGDHLIETGAIEVAPLAYMRGRTLNDSFIILDEAQNTTPDQMKMFLTRLGFNSKMVVTGDVTQIDLANGRSGLKEVRSILNGIDGIAFVELGAGDVVRHSLVSRIVEAYAEADKQREREGTR